MTTPSGPDKYEIWLQRVNRHNIRQLCRPRLELIAGRKLTLRDRLRREMVYLLKRRDRPHPASREIWVTAVNALGVLASGETYAGPQWMDATLRMLHRHFSAEGEMLYRPHAIDAAMKGYSMVDLIQRGEGGKWLRAATERLGEYYLTSYPRTADNVLPYHNRSTHVLVDSIGMVSPFFTQFGQVFGRDEAIDLAVEQILKFTDRNLDPETGLPYHAYGPTGVNRLGMHGWGRGAGWLLLGVTDTLVHLPTSHAKYSTLRDLYQALAAAVLPYQRPDGHWSWAIPMPDSHIDSSATAFLGYCLTRGVMHDLLDQKYAIAAGKALDALYACTQTNGLVGESLAEAIGVGLYRAHFGPQPWVQGMTAAFAAEYLKLNRLSANVG